MRRLSFAALAALVLAVSGATPVARAAGKDDTGRPTFAHVMVVVLENQSYEDLIGNRDAPFMNDVLERDHASATRFFAPFHNSPSDYFALVSGYGYAKGDHGEWGGTCLPSKLCSTDDVSVLQQLNEAGKRWRVYSEDQQAPCQTRNSGKYWVGHNPAVFYQNLGPNDYTTTGNGSCLKDDVAATELSKDLAAGTLPELSFLIPDNCNNMHDECKPLSDRIKQGDAWLKSLLAEDAYVPGGLIAWAQANDTLVVITEDEGAFSDHSSCCPYTADGGGGHIATWVIGPSAKVKADGYQSEVDYSLYSILRMVQTNFGLPLLGHAADDVTADMSDFFPSRIRLARGADVAGVSTTVSGVDFAPNERVSIRWDCDRPGCDGRRLATVTADGNGSFETRVEVPATATIGSHRIGASGGSSGRFGVSSFTIRSPLTANPTATFRGGPISIEGAGFNAGEVVRLTLTCADTDCGPIALGEVRADNQGAFAPTDVTVPPQAHNARYLLHATGVDSARANQAVVWVVEGITLDPVSGPSGTAFTVAGHGYVPGSEVQLLWDCRETGCSQDAVLGTVKADGAGDFTKAVTVPDGATDGNVAIGAKGMDNRDFARSFFKVKAPLALYPNTAPPGRKVALSGAGFAPDESVEIRWGCETAGCERPIIATGQASDDGELSAVEVVVPDNMPGGTYSIGGTGESSGIFATTQFTVAPRVTMSPSKGAAGWNVTLDGAGFGAGQPVTFSWTCPDGSCNPSDPLTAAADDTGRLAGFRLQVPPDSELGSKLLTVTPKDGDAIELPYEVLQPGTAAGTVPPPATGAPSAPQAPERATSSLGSFFVPVLAVGILLLVFLLVPAVRGRRGRAGS